MAKPKPHVNLQSETSCKFRTYLRFKPLAINVLYSSTNYNKTNNLKLLTWDFWCLKKGNLRGCSVSLAECNMFDQQIFQLDK